ncbi:pimeloyl-ACP methyl ester carboxylesterase [Streptacidiphilus sp. MAP12-33]|uniref:alpha/beta fold hydrolase n=1 Tax=Streptacidiphilus sp. MAP12-33 TaxID=3156266 RepID=UPI0035130F0F
MLDTGRRLDWSPAGVDGADPRLEYATLEVPLDHADPGGERITIALSRLRATDPARRRGVLVGVTGGPGGDGGLGRDMPARLAATRLAEVYDLVGLDPRGTGASTPLRIELTPVTSVFDSRPPDAAFAAMAADMRERELGCERIGGAMRPHVNTRNLARDLDALRVALGEEKLSFLGYAYGSYVGAVYGTMFPAHLDRSVLDSCVHPNWTWREQFLAQGRAVRENVELWAGWTARRAKHFGLGGTADEVVGAVERVVARLETGPGVAARTAFDGIVGGLATDRSAWARLGLLVGELLDATGGDATGGDPTGGDATGGDATGGDPTGGHAHGGAVDGERVAALLAEHGTGGWGARASEQWKQSVLEAVTLETAWPTDLETYYADMRAFRAHCPYGHGVLRAAPWVGAFRTFQSPEPPTVLAREGYPAGVIVQADGDPMDHREGGEALAERLGHHLITVKDSGEHEVYLLAGANPALEALVEGYLVEGVLPPYRVSVSGSRQAPPVPEDD